MANERVTVLKGVGEKTADAFRSHGIRTVGDLANVKPGAFAFPSLGNFIRAAKAYLDSSEKETKTPDRIFLGGEDTKHADDSQTRFLLKDHTWFSQVVNIPHPMSTPTSRRYEPAVIYDLQMDPNERVSFVCEWLAEMKDATGTMREVTCKHSYSGVLLMHFNPQLPELRCEIAKEDIPDIPYHTLVNTIWEINQMKK